ncbi:MAG: phage tail tube protein [Thermoanaerobaculia bacterium]
MGDVKTGAQAEVYLDFESALNTVKGTITPRKIGIVKESWDGTRKLIPNPTIRPDGNKADPATGNNSAMIPFEHVATIDSVPWFFRWFCHNLATTGAGDPYTHVSKFNLSTATIMSAVGEVKFGTSLYKRFKGGRLKKLSIKVSSEGFLILSLDGVATTVYDGASGSFYSAETPTDWTASTPFDMSQLTAAGSITVGGVLVGYIRSLDIEGAVNLGEDDYRADGTGNRSGIPVGDLDLKLKLSIAFEGATQYAIMQRAVTSKMAMVINYSQGANRTLAISIPRGTVQTALPAVESSAGIYKDIEILASYDASALSSLVFTTINANPGTLYA